MGLLCLLCGVVQQEMDGKDAAFAGKRETGVVCRKLRLYLTGLLWAVPLLPLQRFDLPKIRAMRANPIRMSVPLKAEYSGVRPCTVILSLTRPSIPNWCYFLKGHFKKVGKIM